MKLGNLPLEPVVAPPPGRDSRPMLRKQESVVSFKETTEEFSFLEYSTEPEDSAVNTTLTLSPQRAILDCSLLPSMGPSLEACLLGEGILLEWDRAVAGLVSRLEGRGEEAAELERQILESKGSDRQMVEVVGEFERTLDQLLEERGRERGWGGVDGGEEGGGGADEEWGGGR